MIPKVYFLDTDVITKIRTGHTIIAGAEKVIISLWKHCKTCNPRDREGEMPAYSTSPYSRKNVTVTLLLLEQALSTTIFPWHLVISSCEVFPGEPTILPNKKYFSRSSFQQNSNKALLSWTHTWLGGSVPSPPGTIVDAPSIAMFSLQFWSRTYGQSLWLSRRNAKKTWGPSGSQGRHSAGLLYKLSGNLLFHSFLLQEWSRIRGHKTLFFHWMSHPEWIILSPSVLPFPYLQNGHCVKC